MREMAAVRRRRATKRPAVALAGICSHALSGMSGATCSCPSGPPAYAAAWTPPAPSNAQTYSQYGIPCCIAVQIVWDEAMLRQTSRILQLLYASNSSVHLDLSYPFLSRPVKRTPVSGVLDGVNTSQELINRLLTLERALVETCAHVFGDLSCSTLCLPLARIALTVCW